MYKLYRKGPGWWPYFHLARRVVIHRQMMSHNMWSHLFHPRIWLPTHYNWIVEPLLLQQNLFWMAMLGVSSSMALKMELTGAPLLKANGWTQSIHLWNINITRGRLNFAKWFGDNVPGCLWATKMTRFFRGFICEIWPSRRVYKNPMR